MTYLHRVDSSRCSRSIIEYVCPYSPGKKLNSSRPGGRHSIPPIFECAWICGKSKVASGFQQHLTNVVQWCMVRILFPYVISTNFGNNLVGNIRNISLPIVSSVEINSSIAFLLLDKWNMVNDVPKWLWWYCTFQSSVQLALWIV